MPSLIVFIPTALSPPAAAEEAPEVQAPVMTQRLGQILATPDRTPEDFLRRRLPIRGAESEQLAASLLHFATLSPEEFEALPGDRPADTDELPVAGPCLEGILPASDRIRLNLGASIKPGDACVVVSRANVQWLGKIFIGMEGDDALFWCAQPNTLFSIPVSWIRWAERIDAEPVLPPAIRARCCGGPWEPPRKGESIRQAYNDWIVEVVGILRDIKHNLAGRLPYKPVPGAPFSPIRRAA